MNTRPGAAVIVRLSSAASRLRSPKVALIGAAAASAIWCAQAKDALPSNLWLRAFPLMLAAPALAPRRVHDSAALRLATWTSVVFLVSAALSLAAAYDHSTATAKLWMVVGAVALAFAIAEQSSPDDLIFSLGFMTVGCAVVSMYFVLTNDWTAPPVASKFPLLMTVANRLTIARPAIPGLRIHPNVIAGIIASLLPLAVPVAVCAARPTARAAAVAAGATGLAALILTTSRGAWLATAAVAATRVLAEARRPTRRVTAARSEGHSPTGPRRPGWSAILVLALMTASAVVARQAIADALAPAGRLSIYAAALTLARDYAFTGAGLAAFPMHFALYARLSPVPSTIHAHNLFLDIAFEQGLPGLIGYLLIVGATLLLAWPPTRSRQPAVNWVAQAALASTGVVVLHGLVDDTLYATPGIVVLFVPLGMAAAAARLGSDSRETVKSLNATVAIIALAVVISVVILHPSAAGWSANLGALAQARAELQSYDPNHFDRPTLDEVRRTADLDRPIARFREAERIDAGNPTARRRLTMLLLAGGAYRDGLRHIESQWTDGDRSYATRALFGQALIANGRLDDAVRLLAADDAAPRRLKYDAWYRYWTSGDVVRAADAWAAAERLDPSDAEARHWAATARAQLGNRP